MSLVLGDEVRFPWNGRRNDGQPSGKLLRRGALQSGGRAPNCLVAKHEVGGTARFFWSTEFDSPRPIKDLSEITDAHIRAIRPPRNEKGWLDPTGWMGVYASRLIATQLQVV